MVKETQSQITQNKEITKLLNRKQIYSSVTKRPITFYDDSSITNMQEYVPTPYGDTKLVIDNNKKLNKIEINSNSNAYYIAPDGKRKNFGELMIECKDDIKLIDSKIADKKYITPTKSIVRAKYKGKMVPFEMETVSAVQSICHFDEYDIMIFESYTDPKVDLILVINMLNHHLVATFTDIYDFNEAIQAAVDAIANDVTKEIKQYREEDAAALIDDSEFNIKHIMIETSGDDSDPFEFNHNIPKEEDEINNRIKAVSSIDPASWARVVDLQKRLDGLYDKDMSNETLDQIYNVLREQRRLALNCGVATFACTVDDSGMIDLCETTENTVLEHVKKCIEDDSFIPVNIICDKAIDKADVSKLYELVKKLLHTYNSYVREVS